MSIHNPTHAYTKPEQDYKCFSMLRQKTVHSVHLLIGPKAVREQYAKRVL